MTVSVPHIEKLLAEATERPWHEDSDVEGNPLVTDSRRAVVLLGGGSATPVDATLTVISVNALPVLIAVVKACEHAGVCKLCDRLVRIHGHRTGCPIASFSFEEQA